MNVWQGVECAGLQAAVDTIVELRLPFSCLEVRPHDVVSLIVALHRNGFEIEHYPGQRAIEFSVPDADFTTVNWTA
jgi:hypothetical protein